MKRKTSYCQDPNEDDNEAEKQNLVSMFKRIHKFQTKLNTEIEIRVGDFTDRASFFLGD